MPETSMQISMLKCKLHRAVVTQSNMHYEGSISIDRNLLSLAGILPHERVDVLNIDNGQRFTTYAIEAPAGSSAIGINGAAARLVQVGDRVIIIAYCAMAAHLAQHHEPTVVLLDEHNAPTLLKAPAMVT